MATRGAYGFRLNGVEKLFYNHYDSYPEGLGLDIARWWIQEGQHIPTHELHARVRNLKEVKGRDADVCIPEIQKKLKAGGWEPHHEKDPSLYGILPQGNMPALLEIGYGIGGAKGGIEYRYIFDLDQGVLEMTYMLRDEVSSFPLDNLQESAFQ